MSDKRLEQKASLDAKVGPKIDDPFQRALEKRERLKETSTVLQAEYQQYEAKAREHGRTLCRFDTSWEELDRILSTANDDEWKQIIGKYKSRSEDEPAGYEIWDEKKLSENFALLFVRLGESTSKAILELFIESGQILKELDYDLKNGTLGKRIYQHNKEIDDYNRYYSPEIDKVDFRNYNDISEEGYIEELEELEE